MAMYITRPWNTVIRLTTLDTAINNPTTAPVQFSAPSSPANIAYQIQAFRVKAYGTTTAGTVRIFYSYDGGSNKQLMYEIPVTAVTPSATINSFEYDLVLPVPDIVPVTNFRIYATTEKSENFNVMLRAGCFD